MEVRTLFKDLPFFGKLFLLIHLHFHHVIKLHLDKDDLFISASTKYELNQGAIALARHS